MRKSIVLGLMLLFAIQVNAQRYFTREGDIEFFSEAPVENIEANNNKVLCIIDLEKGQVAVDLLIKAFEFEKKLMQEHFNENYMESENYPKATYKGEFEVADGLKEMKEGEYLIPVVGEITIHGVKQKLDTSVKMTVEGENILTTFEFTVNVEDHDIEIPNLVIDNISEVILVTANFTLTPYKR